VSFHDCTFDLREAERGEAIRRERELDALGKAVTRELAVINAKLDRLNEMLGVPAEVPKAASEPQREESPPEREHTEQLRELESPGLTVAQAMQRLGFTDRRAFFASVKLLGLSYSQPSPLKIFFHPADVEDAIERARTLRR